MDFLPVISLTNTKEISAAFINATCRKYSHTSVVNQISQPANVKEALAQPGWLKAMQDDL